MVLPGLTAAGGVARATPFQEYRQEASFLEVFGPGEPQFRNEFPELAAWDLGELDTASKSYSGQGFSYVISTTGYNLYAAGTADDPWLTSVNSVPPLVVSSISGPPRGLFGIGGQFFLTNDVGARAAGSLTVAATLAGGGTFTTTLAEPQASDFFGLVANRPITDFRLTSATPRLYPTIGGILMIVPEPRGMGLAGAAALCLAARRLTACRANPARPRGTRLAQTAPPPRA
ncbi:MAG: hypothetical protein EBZ74_10650 [Planctomycetia bacterium]|nr:hypothetical protein [Planctomycetia bacterium]